MKSEIFKKNTLILTVMVATIQLAAQNYYFNNTISQEVLSNYLNKSITMQGQSDVEGTLMLNDTARKNNIAMLNRIGAKFIGRVAGWWENGYGQSRHDELFSKCSTNVAEIKANDPNVICQAAVFEYVSTTVETIDIPSYVFTDFQLPISNRKFNYSSMLYPSPANQYKIYSRVMDNEEITKIPDISQQETQLWFYYMATRYISSGCEAIHFGQAEIMNRRDIGNKKFWTLIEKIRLFAKQRNRGVVICDAHVPSGGMYYEPNISLNLQQWNDYTPINNLTGRLLFDFHSMGVIFEESSPCTSSHQPAIIKSSQNNTLHGKSLYNRSLGGINPQGWYCTSNPFLVEFDNGDIDEQVGCNYDTNKNWYLWGWDEISWFASQPEAKRNEILKYSYYKVKCLDRNGHLEMQGMRNFRFKKSEDEQLYRANYDFHNQEETIKSLWNNEYEGEYIYKHNNFMDNNVLQQPFPPHVKSSLITYGNERIYYISNDGYIHGYIKNKDLNIWQTVSPSHSANQYGGTNIVNQVKAKSNLVLSPDGATLLYIGIDNFIHGFNVIDVWNYRYFDFDKQSMISQNIRAEKDLLFTSNTRIFYIAKENNIRLTTHGFIKYNGNWTTVSPTYSSQVNSLYITEVGGGLTYSKSNDRLYYVGKDSFLHYFKIIDDWRFTYHKVPKQQLVAQGLTIMSNKIAVSGNSVFFIGKESTNQNALRIHELNENNGTWRSNSPSWASKKGGSPLPINVQVQSNGVEIAVSPDGTQVAYTGINGKLYIYKKITTSTWEYTYNETFDSNDILASNSLQFFDNNLLIYVFNQLRPHAKNYKIYGVKLEESYCSNPLIKLFEPRSY